jgi:hypothetical protein
MKLVGSGRVRKISSPSGLERQTLQSVANRYDYYAVTSIPACQLITSKYVERLLYFFKDNIGSFQHQITKTKLTL